MQFAGQHPGGLGVPAVGMAFPGYVGQPNGMGNSEMTWYYSLRILSVPFSKNLQMCIVICLIVDVFVLFKPL